MTIARARWSNLLKHGLIGTSLVGAAAGRAAAEPCDEIASKTVGFVLGLELSQHPRLIGGIEGRACLNDKTEAMVRVEFGGGTRLIAGARVRPFEEAESDSDREWLGIEGGLVLGAHQRFGLHAAATYGSHSGYGALQALAALSDGAPTRFAILGGLAPWTLREQVDTGVPGRPLQHAGQYLCPRIVRPQRACASREERAVREHFEQSAQLELSSVWTFLRLAHELAAVGAPASLVEAALDAADDEVRHAEMCARAAGGVALMPLPMEAAQPRFTRRTSRALAVLAGEAWREGCFNEGAAAEEARLAAAEADGDARVMLSTIAVDESRHAELSWAVLAWVCAVDPASARAAVADVGDEAAEEPRVFDPALARHGVPSPRIADAARAHARREMRSRYGS
jgi:hypothetical protein